MSKRSERWAGVRGRGRSAAVFSTVLAAVMLTSCQGAPVVEEQETMSNASVEELRAWVADEIDAVVETTAAIDAPWVMLLDQELDWAGNREEIFASSHLPQCTFDVGEQNAASVQVDLIAGPLDGDPFALVVPVRERWEAAGWDISEVGGADYIRADRADGALMTFEAAEGRAGRFISLMVVSPCSADPSVAR